MTKTREVRGCRRVETREENKNIVEGEKEDTRWGGEWAGSGELD